MNFETWLKKQKHRDDRIGDLAKDFIDGQQIKKCKTILESMKHFCAGDAAIESLAEAQLEYLNELDKLRNGAREGQKY